MGVWLVQHIGRWEGQESGEDLQRPQKKPRGNYPWATSNNCPHPGTIFYFCLTLATLPP